MSRARESLDVRGELQAKVMAAVWKLGEASVEDVRSSQPPKARSAYTTLQTVMNRLVDRGLLSRERRGKAFVYRARYMESEHLARAIGDRLADASPDTRKAAVVSLVDLLDADEVDAVARYADEVRRRRTAEDGDD
jgi:predicted transcriptional regulator